MQISGWLFDAYPCTRGMIMWILDEAGQMHSCTSAYHPVFYLTGPVPLLKQARNWFTTTKIPLRTEWVEKREFYSDDLVLGGGWIEQQDLKSPGPGRGHQNKAEKWNDQREGGSR